MELRTCKSCMAIIALLFAGAVSAGEAAVSWTAPTERVDGTPLTNLAGFRLKWGLSPGSYTYSVEINDPGATAHTVSDLGSGTWYFVVTAFDANGLESANSNEASKAITESPPLPPVLSVNSGVVYALIQSENRLALVPVGTVPAGTACDPAQQIRDLNGVHGYVVPREAVVWAGSVRPVVVVAECS